MNEPNDPKLKRALAEMVAAQIEIHEQCHGLDPKTCYFWRDGQGRQVLETEWLYIVSLAEQGLGNEDFVRFEHALESIDEAGEKQFRIVSSSFNQRATALCQAKGITI